MACLAGCFGWLLRSSLTARRADDPRDIVRSARMSDSPDRPPKYSVLAEDDEPPTYQEAWAEIMEDSQREIVAYWEDWNCWQTRITDISSKYSTYNVAFATVNTDGQTLHSQGKKVCISIGGATDTGFIGDPAILAQNIVDFIQTHDLDGVDLDYEHIVNFADGQANFIKLIRQLRSKLDTTFTTRKIISYTALPNGVDDKAPAYPQDYNYNQAVAIMQQCADKIDRVQIMCYNKIGIDYTRAQDEVEQFAQYFPKSKIVLGIMPGLDDQQEDCPLSGSDQSCETLASYAATQGLKGIMIWDANRDLAGQDNTPPKCVC